MTGYDTEALRRDDTLGTDEVAMTGGYSRSNEDEVIGGLLARTSQGNRICVDIGAKDLENSNVANLIINHGWRGVLIDRGIKNFHRLFAAWDAWPICLMYLTVTPKNVNDVLPEDFQVLSVDIDGQDYHVWQALKARPPIVVIEYNPRKKGHDVQPRDDKYEWKKIKDYSRFGASRDALVSLGRSKGYALAEQNNDNLFFTLD